MGHIGDGVYRSIDSTSSVKALKEDRVLRIRLQSNQVHPIALTILRQYEKKIQINVRIVKWVRCDKTKPREL